MPMRKADRDGATKAPKYSPRVRTILGRLQALAYDLHNLPHAEASELQGALDRITAYTLLVGDDIECPLGDAGIDWTLVELDLCDGASDTLSLRNRRSKDEIEKAFRKGGA
jgi:hypothetical protein